MNWQITERIKNKFELEGFQIAIESSKTTDYITLSIEGGWRDYTIRISDHDAMTGRSKCADIGWNTSELHSEWDGKFEGLACDEDGDPIEFDTKEEKDAANINVILEDVKNSQGFYDFCKYTKFEFAA